MPNGPRLLVVRFSSLGDVILTTPLLRALRHTYPDADITFVTRQAYAPVLDGNARLNRVAALSPGEPLGSLARRLPPGGFDACLDLHGSLRSRAFRRLVPGRWSAHRKHRGRRWRLLWMGGHAAGSGVAAAERYFAAASDLGVVPDGEPAEVFPSPADRRKAASLARTPFVALAAGARHWSKRWPARHWRALADGLMARGLNVAATGTTEERRLLSGGGVIDAYGRSLGVTAALFEQAQTVVANDSGLMHLASAVRRPVVALFGPTVRAFGFTPYRTPATILERPLHCRPCSSTGGAFCPLLHHRCLETIRPDQVKAAVLAA